MERDHYRTRTTAAGQYVRSEKEKKRKRALQKGRKRALQKGRKRAPPKTLDQLHAANKRSKTRKEEGLVVMAEEEEEEEEEKVLPFFGFKSDRDMKKYLKQVEESERFDVDYFPGTRNTMHPMNLNRSTLYHEAIDFVIERYNMRNEGRPIKVIRLEKCIREDSGWPVFYMTFKGRDVAEKKVKTYQAIVMLVPGLDFVLRMLRVKPAKDAPRGKKHPHDECCGACYKDDVNFLEDGTHVLDSYPGDYTLEGLERYYEQLEDSEGFDIDPFPDIHSLCFITFMQRPWRKEFAEEVDKETHLVKEFFSKDKGVQLCDLKVLKVNYLNGYCCPHSYMTFEAKEGDNGEMKTYQARIATVPGQPKVEEVRLKPCKS